MMKLSKIRDNEMIMISKMRDKINIRKKRLNLEEAKGQEPRNCLDLILFFYGRKCTYFLSRSGNFLGMDQWKKAIKSEIDSILQNHTWELVDLVSGCKPLGYKWIFKKKMKVNGTIEKYKARLEIKEFRQREGQDYFDTYLPVTRITSIRMVLAIAALRKMKFIKWM
nr:zinc finger CCCH domain-containing protein 14 [Tanacetum cinerariifolium]